MGAIDLQTFSNRLKLLRSILNITQKDFAEKIGVTAAALSAYENNQKNPSVAVVQRIAGKFHVSVDWLCGLSDKMEFDEKPQRFSDIIRILFQIEPYLQMKPFFKHPVLGDITASIIFSDSEMQEFIQEWDKMKELYNEELIDEEVYNLWKEKALSKYTGEVNFIDQDD